MKFRVIFIVIVAFYILNFILSAVTGKKILDALNANNNSISPLYDSFEERIHSKPLRNKIFSSSTRNSTSYTKNLLLLADAGDESATDAKQFEKRSSFSFPPPPPPTSYAHLKSSSNRLTFREMLNRNNNNYGNSENAENFVDSSHFTFRPPKKQSEIHSGIPFTYTREVHVKQGRLIGIVREMNAQSRIKNVDKFLGIPYAEARRFMPPSSPLPWQGVKYASKYQHVCPQKLPNLNDPSGYNKGRYDQIKRLLPYLKNESEDCLYLNIFVINDSSSLEQNYPVIVFLHESFEWNSGNSYDGSILASYGQVIVITLNYRLGALGFLKPGLNDQTVANFGLLDIIAALQWIKENIKSFGGNRESVTLLGFEHGAILANFLMISPVAKGLFHRTILMSGSALADWALNYNPQQITLQVAKKLNCAIEDVALGNCLRAKSYREIMNVSLISPEFTTIFGPIVDGLVVPSDPYDVMAHSDSFGRFDLLFGMTELESFNILGRDAIQNGITQVDRDHNLRKYLANRFDKRLEVAFLSTLKEYSDIFLKSKSMSFYDHRDVLLEILSDARVTAPLIQTGIYLSRRNPKCFMYVFAHNAEAGEYATMSQSVHGEELQFVFGAPIDKVGPFIKTYYNVEERQLSEATMKYFSNFAKNGNPMVAIDFNHWDKYNVDWQEFNEINQNYLLLGIQPVVSARYRYKYTKYWNEGLIETMHNANSINQFGKFSNLPSTSRSRPASMPLGKVISMYPIEVINENPTDDPIKILRHQLLLQQRRDSNNNFHTREHTNDKEITTATESINFEQILDEHNTLTSETSTMYFLICIIVTFLLVNMMGLLIYLYRKNRKISRKSDSSSFFASANEDKRSKFNDTDDTSFILDIIRKSSNNTYESVKRHSPINGYAINRQTSSSTVDTHTKVNDWITNEITGTSRSKQNSFLTSQSKEKISIGIDATPQARSNSILRQEPIEVTKAKSLDYGSHIGRIICQEIDMDVSMIDEIPFREFCNTSNKINDNCFDETSSDFSSCSSASQFCEECACLKKNDTCEYEESRKLTYDQAQEKITSFIENPQNINCTSRDSPLAEKCPLSSEEMLKAIQKMNYPKVLPSYPENVQLNNAMKRRSLQVPPQFYQIHEDGKIPIENRQLSRPEPPPRSSTLGRMSRNEDKSSYFMTKPLKAEEPPSIDLPTMDITESTLLVVGPIIPKKSENIYMTMHRNKSFSRKHSISAHENNQVSNEEKMESNEDPTYSEVIKNSSKIKTKPDKQLEQKIINYSQERSSSTSSSSNSSTGTIKKIN